MVISVYNPWSNKVISLNDGTVVQPYGSLTLVDTESPGYYRYTLYEIRTLGILREAVEAGWLILIIDSMWQETIVALEFLEEIGYSADGGTF